MGELSLHLNLLAGRSAHLWALPIASSFGGVRRATLGRRPPAYRLLRLRAGGWGVSLPGVGFGGLAGGWGAAGWETGAWEVGSWRVFRFGGLARGLGGWEGLCFLCVRRPWPRAGMGWSCHGVGFDDCLAGAQGGGLASMGPRLLPLRWGRWRNAFAKSCLCLPAVCRQLGLPSKGLGARFRCRTCKVQHDM